MNFTDIYKTNSVRKIMFLVIIACLPSICVKYYFFGSRTLINILLSIIIAFLLEIIILKIRVKNISMHLKDNSLILTAVLFGVSIPSSLPWWIIIIGIFFSIAVAKHLYGGIGQNIFNPAMVGYAVLLISFPVDMNDWNKSDISLYNLTDVKKSLNFILTKYIGYSFDNTNLKNFPDAFTEATPLNDFKIKSYSRNNYMKTNDVYKNKTVTIKNSWKYINISFFLGGVFLLFQKIICWRIPISFLSSLGLLSGITYFYSKDLFMSPLFHFFSGGTMICAFFIATDPVTTACTNKGKIIFGVVVGFIVWIIRNYSDYPDGIAFAVLFANLLTPLIDYYIKTSGYGHNST